MRQVNLRLDDDLLEAIELSRGATKRDPYIRELLRAQLALPPQPTLSDRRSRPAARVPSSHQAKRGVMPVPKPGKR